MRQRRRSDHGDPLLRLVVVLAVVVGCVTIVSTGVAIYAVVELGHQQGQIKANFARSQVDRAVTVSAFCNAINSNARAANNQTDYLRAVVVSGVKQSRVFDDAYRAHGAPSYEERLKQARVVAEALKGRKIPVLVCKRFTDRVRKAAVGR